MGAIASLVGDAVNAAVGNSSGSTLEDFLSKYSAPGQKYVNTLDPLGTFDVSFKFFPAAVPTGGSSGWTDRMLGSIGSTVTSAAKNALDSVTGGLFSSATATDVMGAHNGFGDAGKHSFMEYLAEANQLVGGENWFSTGNPSSPLELQLGLYVQSITVPNMRMGGDAKASSPLGDFPVNGGFVMTDGTLQMTMVNTKAALHERLFSPWMRECCLPYWSYEDQPYTTATVTIDYTKHNDVKYVFTGVRPTQINMLQATQDATDGNLTRDVTFMFDFMFVTSDLKTVDSVKDKLLGSAGAMASGAANMLGL